MAHTCPTTHIENMLTPTSQSLEHPVYKGDGYRVFETAIRTISLSGPSHRFIYSLKRCVYREMMVTRVNVLITIIKIIK